MYNDPKVAEEYDATRFWAYEDAAGRVPLLTHVLELNCCVRLLDVGCGTGYYLERLMAYSGCHGVGVDRSISMLSVAKRQHPDLELCQAAAGQLPLADGAIGALLCHNALHHFDDVPQFLREAWRVLSARGRIALVTVSHGQMRSNPIYFLFPGILEIDLRRIPDTKLMREWMREAGFLEVASREVERSSIRLSWDVVLQFVERKCMSPMRMMPDSAFRSAHGIFAERVRNSGFATCPAEDYTITTGLRGLGP